MSEREIGLNPFASLSISRNEDEEALRWAAIQKLPTYNRLRTSILQYVVEGDQNDESRKTVMYKDVDVRKLNANDRQEFVERNFKVAEQDNDKFLRKIRDRIDKVMIQLPTVEVRFNHLQIEADCYIGTRALPTLLNTARNIAESALGLCGITLAKKINLTILKDVSGIIKPSRMTLLLGPPSSGKTTLLLALAGKLDPNLKVQGQVTYNGHRLDEFVPRKTSAYISQNDVHLGDLTVKETLDYSARFQGVGNRYDLLTELARREEDAGIFPEAEVDLFMKAIAMEGAESSLITDYTLKLLGLEICKDTLVGDEMKRGISGGQKKRVTTGEMVVGPTRTLFMDEISTGLDSSTTFQIVKCMQQIVHLTEATILMSLLQPDPETFDLFDDIILLSEGWIIYQGPREHVLEFFESCGFKCPERKGTADFLQEVTSKKDQEQYWADRNKPFFKQLLVVFLIQQMAAGLFRLMAGLCRTMIIAHTGGALSLLLLFLLGGFILPKGRIPVWWSWGHWLSPLSYAFKALTVNEMLSPRWMDKMASSNNTKLGVALLNKFDVPHYKYWYWIGATALLAFTFLFNVLFTFSLMYLNPLGKPQPIISEELANEQSNKGETKGKPRLQTNRHTKALVKDLSTPPEGSTDLYFPTQYSQSTWGQFKSCLWKQWWTYWRSPDYNLVRYFFTLAAALVLGTIFWQVGTKRENTTDLTMIIGAMYVAVLFVGINNCSTVQPVVAVERTVFYRERAAGMYSALPYAIAQSVDSQKSHILNIRFYASSPLPIGGSEPNSEACAKLTQEFFREDTIQLEPIIMCLSTRNGTMPAPHFQYV
ncbi:ABC transporter G family member 29-like [Fagus crenata]